MRKRAQELSSLAGQRIVITGGAGFIGHHSVALALEVGAQVMVVDDLRHACQEPLDSEAELVVAELTTEEAINAIVRFKPHAVLHLAAQGGVVRSFRNPVEDVRANVVATVAVIDACRRADVARLVFSSSGGALYGHAKTIPTPEDATPQPLSPYGLAKLACEQYIHLFSQHGLRSALALRYGNVYGPNQDGTGEAGIVAISVRRILDGKAPIIFGDGLKTRDFIFVKDVARANMQALSSTVAGACNIATGRSTSIREIVDSLIAESGWEGGITHEDSRAGEVESSVLDVSRAKNELYWESKTPLNKGLSMTFDSFARSIKSSSNTGNTESFASLPG
jgi:UDP-glucose 4-epimerase